jgi:predicted DNA-binding transcriptional regulator YafY
VFTQQEDKRSAIQFESNPLLKGLEFLNPLYQAVIHQTPMLIEYQSFKARKPISNLYHPYLLKEYRNRWFLICKPKKGTALLTLALDRMHSIQVQVQEKFMAYKGVDFTSYFDDLIGVTKTEKDRAHKVILHVDAKNLPYVLTKPLHPSQVLLKKEDDGGIIRLDVILNFELEREILGFGEAMKVMAPKMLQARIKRRVELSMAQYSSEEK